MKHWFGFVFLFGCWLQVWATPNTCVPENFSIETVKEEHHTSAKFQNENIYLAQPPQTGWQTATLPDTWTSRWPSHSGVVWYRIQWNNTCSDRKQAYPLGLAVNNIVMAGAVYLNGSLLWRDASLTPPISHSWNMQRWWPLPVSALQPGLNTIWIRVIGPAEMSPGLGSVQLGAITQIKAAHAKATWHGQTVWLYSAILSGVAGSLLGIIWLLRRQEHAFGWYALTSILWMAYLSTLLATQPWPLPWIETTGFNHSLAMSRLNIVILVFYVLSFCIFTFRFGEQKLSFISKVLVPLSTLEIATIVWVPSQHFQKTSLIITLISASIFILNCLQFQWHAWRTRQAEHLMLAACYLVFLVVGIHDLLLLSNWINDSVIWGPISSLAAALCIALLLGWRVVKSTQQIENANQVLARRIAETRTELSQALKREHSRELEHSRLQERMQLTHDLHDGLGGNLVRSIALVEQAERKQQPLSSKRVLSLLKLLRDDLRQMVDHGSNSGAAVPATPTAWLAPLRRRFTRLFDELEIEWQWHMPTTWSSQETQPSALQCLHLARIIEEALANALKHSRARMICVSCTQPQPDTLLVSIEDDGIGFEKPQHGDDDQQGDLGIGMRSMAARAERIGGALQVTSSPGKGTRIQVHLSFR